MYAIVLLIVVAILSLLITRIATIVLTVTGMSQESARFQARSALSGVGFTTTEAESVVSHPVRRRVVLTLMLVGNVGLVTAVAALLGGFLGAGRQEALIRVALLVGSLATLYAAASSAWVDARLRRLIARGVTRFTDLDARDYASLLRLSGGYTVNEIRVKPGTWLADRTLRDLRLKDEGAVVLGVQREDGGYIGAPDGDTEVRPGDVLTVYGHRDDFAELGSRKDDAEGQRSRDEAVRTHERRQAEERAADARDQDEREAAEG
jgi:hypothetical protein